MSPFVPIRVGHLVDAVFLVRSLNFSHRKRQRRHLYVDWSLFTRLFRTFLHQLTLAPAQIVLGLRGILLELFEFLKHFGIFGC